MLKGYAAGFQEELVGAAIGSLGRQDEAVLHLFGQLILEGFDTFSCQLHVFRALVLLLQEVTPF